MIEILVKVILLLGGVMTAAAYFVLLERRMAAWVQDRVGPNRVGIPLTRIRIFGLGQPLADGVKFIMKEEYTPAHVDKRMYVLAPIVILVAALTVFAVIPFGSVLPVDLGIEGLSEPIRLVVAPGMDVAVFVIFGLSSIAVYGVILGGWASNNKYSFLGALRSSAQLIAYELPLGLGILGVVVAAGSLDLEAIISAQATSGWWFILAQPLGCVVFVVAAFAEAARLPFDLPECEQELIGGYHTEYSGIKLLLFLVAEFLHMITAAFLIVILFLGGWHFWGLTGAGEQVGLVQAVLRVMVLSGKVFLVILLFMLIRWSWPRFRFDQLMALAWKVMLPLGLVNLVSVAILDQLRTAWQLDAWWSNPLLIAANWGICLLAWIVVAYAQPLIADNRPQQELELYDVDPQV
ncbi:MAG: NADH-quinone oxidoreductase subunit NuoH [Pirellulaceae bacterium]|nr:NADH-quinone oxidoreductase subunit NuoH [Pirellulaceae bacterium]